MFGRLFLAAELAAQYDQTEYAAYWAALRAADRMRVNIPGISREAIAGAIAGEVPGGFHVAPEMMSRVYAAVPELGRRELRHQKNMARLVGEEA